MTKVIKREYEKLEDLKVKDVSFTCDTSLKIFNNEFNRLSGMNDELFTYEVKVANILCDSNKDDESEQRISHEADDDMGYDPFDVAFTEWLGSKNFNYKTMDHYIMKALWIYQIRGDDEVDLMDEEFSDNEDEVAETYDEYKDDWIYEWNKDIPWVDEKPWTEAGVWIEPKPVKHTYLEWYEALKDSKLKDEALRNKAIMEGLISDDESSNDCWKRWKIHEINYHDYDEGEYENETHKEGRELCIKTHEVPVFQIKRYKMIKYSFNDEEEYVVVKEDEYDDLTNTSKEACRAYQEIFRMMDEGWMVTRTE
ncbi:hypothetical protein Tco_0939594 [Tanacetum coccineum]|uniref:Uncharacterized protein n=1 Tax=Tanacetum coccineum TaxID=301880 RepID=A0ABQ5DSD0_9ASTR